MDFHWHDPEAHFTTSRLGTVQLSTLGTLSRRRNSSLCSLGILGCLSYLGSLSSLACLWYLGSLSSATWLAQLVGRRTAVREVVGSNPRPDQHSGS